MNVTFYINNSDEKSVRKNLTPVKTISCKLKSGATMASPAINVLRDSLPNFRSVNYMYIDTFGRYYFIDPQNVQADTGGELLIGGRVDVLYSNQSAILSLNCVVLRQEFKYNLYYQDAELPIRAQKTFVRKMIGSLPNVTTNILTVDGG